VEEVKIIGCIPVNEEDRKGIPYTPPEGATIVECQECGMEIWLGPESKWKATVEKIPIWCIMCCAAEDPSALERVQMVRDADNLQGG